MPYKPLPIGIDDFEKIISNDYYYVDKTLFIKELLKLKSEVNLFTRPRRFGKTLNLSMLQYFFENTGNEKNNNHRKDLFKNLKITNEDNLCKSHMCQYPVINISLKSAKNENFEMAYNSLKNMIIDEYTRHQYLINSDKLNKRQISLFKKICLEDTASDSEFYNSLKFLSQCLNTHFNEKVIILIDEYDVPLENAYHNNFYKKMINFIRSFFEGALKTNPCLYFSVITGCLRISKESIFTRLNNFEPISILNKSYSEHFGFTNSDIDEILSFFEFNDVKEKLKYWYNGYMFGNTEVYNPWSIINYVKSIYIDINEFPKPYWSNTSSNNIVKKLVHRNSSNIKDSIENLINGRSMEIQIHEEITYEDIESNDENIWNFLFFTGYLKKVSEKMVGENIFVTVSIPNREVHYIYKNTILQWFEETIKEKDMTTLYKAVLEGDVNSFSDLVSDELMNMISYNDYIEAFYHGFLIGIFSKMKNYSIISNIESGLGRPDILIKPRSLRKEAVIIELKKVNNIDDMEVACEEALKQIEENRYEEYLRKDGFRKFIKYGVAFYKKECLVKKAEHKE